MRVCGIVGVFENANVEEILADDGSSVMRVVSGAGLMYKDFIISCFFNFKMSSDLTFTRV